MGATLKFQISTALVVASLAIVLTHANLRGEDGRRLPRIQRELVNPVPIELGGVEGKTYFVQFLNEMTWFEARDYCMGRSLRLGTVETEAQLDFLVEALRPHGRQMMWTAARESRGPSMFVWEGRNGLQPNATVLPVWGDQKDYLPYYHCGAFWANGNYSQFWTDTCEDAWQRFALCQA